MYHAVRFLHPCRRIVFRQVLFCRARCCCRHALLPETRFFRAPLSPFGIDGVMCQKNSCCPNSSLVESTSSPARPTYRVMSCPSCAVPLPEPRGVDGGGGLPLPLRVSRARARQGGLRGHLGRAAVQPGVPQQASGEGERSEAATTTNFPSVPCVAV